jgi:Nitrous oxide reductase
MRQGGARRGCAETGIAKERVRAMSEDKAPKSPTRREFFRRAGLGAGALAGAVALGDAVAGNEAKAAEAAPKSQGYRETEHVKRVYELARF